MVKIFIDNNQTTHHQPSFPMETASTAGYKDGENEICTWQNATIVTDMAIIPATDPIRRQQKKDITWMLGSSTPLQATTKTIKIIG